MLPQDAIAIESDVTTGASVSSSATLPSKALDVGCVVKETMKPIATPTLSNSDRLSAGVVRPRWVARLLSGDMVQKGVLSLIDQGVVSAVNFLTLVLLGRHMGHGSSDAAQQELGLYYLGFGIVLLAMCAQNSLIAIPYTVFGHRMEGQRRANYAGSTLVQQAGLTVTISLILVIAGCITGIAWAIWGFENSFGKIVWVLAAALPMIAIREFVRRIAFAHLQVLKALRLDMAVAALQLAGLLALKLSGELTAFTAFITIGIACVVAGAVVGFSMRHNFVPSRASAWADLKLNWSFGKWAFAGQAVYLVMVYCVTWILFLLDGTEATGQYAACMSLVLVANPLLLGLNNFLSPHAIQTFHSHGADAMRRLLWRTSIAICGAVSILCAVLICGGAPLLGLIYNSIFAGEQQIVSVLSLNLFLFGVSMSAENGLLAVGRPKAIFVAHVVGLLVTVAAAIVLIKTHGALGAAVAAVLGQAVATLWKCILLGVAIRDHSVIEATAA